MTSTESRLRDYLKQTTTELRNTKRRLREIEQRDSEPVAIVGMACRFPGGTRSPEDLWDMVRDGRDVVGSFPEDRGWDLEGLYDPGRERVGTSYTREGAFLDDVAGFDAGFFDISPREAVAMDPQQRLFLQVCWEALERARIVPETLRDTLTGVYLGATDHDYGRHVERAPDRLLGNLMIGRSGAVTAGRVAYTLGLAGPALTVDTMCSSSLVALHLAAEALRGGECDMALTGGTTVMSTPEGFVEFSAQGALAADGRCKSFGEAADGTGWCEGVGALLLERLSDARRNGHPVLALLRGSAINQDGASNGLTAPNGEAQRRVIRRALRGARVAPEEVDLVEAHGTGTVLGDPIEANALLATYGQARREGSEPLRLGSLKSNMGHSAAAAGVAGVIKSVMALRHRTLPRTLHADPPSTSIDWAGRIELLHRNRPWESQGHPRRVGVSAFGASGTNAHVILEEAPSAEENPDESAGTSTGTPLLKPGGPLLWPLSGRGEGALRDQARSLADRSTGTPEVGAADVSRSLATTRTAFEHRAVLVGTEPDGFVEGLTALAEGTEHPRVVRGRAPSEPGGIVFVFPGQGAQWRGMARRLAAESPVFAEALRECAEALDPLTDWPVLDVLLDEAGAAEKVDLDRVDVVQPALFAMMVSLARMWRAAGVEPAAVVGHSQGEIAAACVSGALSLEDAARVVALRSARIKEITGDGGMLSVALPRDRAEELVAERPSLSLAVVNGAASVVLSGDEKALDGLAVELEEQGVRTRRVPVDYASHSAHVERIREGILIDLKPIVPRTSETPLYSTVTGTLLDTAEMDADYWYRNLRGTVELDTTVRSLADAGHTAFIEVSPHPVVLPAIEETLESAGTEHPLTTGTLRRDDGGADRFLTSLAHMHAHGAVIDWEAVLAGSGGTVIDLPTYAFQERRYWMEDEERAPETVPEAGPADEPFWNLLETTDPEELAASLGIDPRTPFSAALPALARRRDRDRRGRIADGWRYHEAWSRLKEGVTPRPTGRWLLLSRDGQGRDETRAEIAEHLRRYGARPVEVVLTDGDLERAALCERLRKEAIDGVEGVVSLLAMDDGEQPGHPGLPRPLASTFTCVQAFADSGIEAPLWAITSGAVAVDVSEHVLHPEQTAVWALGRVAALEFPARWGGLIDLPTVTDPADTTLGARLVAALSGGSGEDQVAVRGTASHGRRLRRTDPGPAEPPRWRPRGTVLLTGGTGGIGAQVARWLAELGAPRLVLTSRGGPAAPGADALAASLRALGSEVEIVACDAADAATLADVRERAAELGHPVRTVVHLAGAGVLRPLTETDMTEYSGTTYAKIAGADVLDALFSEPGELDDFILFSSVSAAWGSGDHAAYASANAYLDGLADRRRGRGLPARSVVWGIWSPEEGGGMAADLAEEQLRSRGIPFMDPATAIEGFHRLLDGDRTVEVLAEVDWARFAPVFTMARPSPLLSDLPEARDALLRGGAEQDTDEGDGGESLAERLAGMRPADRSRTLSDLVRTHIAAVLDYTGPDEVDPERALRELGFDSLTAVDLRNRLGAAIGLRLPVTVVFDHPDARALAAHLGGLLLPEKDEGDGHDVAPISRNEPADPDAVEEMDVDSLVRLALGNETQRGEG
ncbi:type I polyketide synthase [Nocardiopsis alba]|uniref:type I polyketide synthase n=1 Tax=Nocardiopsis alba TaxID=53437 RepID=UPI0035D89F3D